MHHHVQHAAWEREKMTDQISLPGLVKEETPLTIEKMVMPPQFDPSSFNMVETPEVAFLLDVFDGRFHFAYASFSKVADPDLSIAGMCRVLPKPYEVVRSARRGINHCELYARTRSYGIHLRLNGHGLFVNVSGHNETDCVELSRYILSHYRTATDTPDPDVVDYGIWFSTEFGTDNEELTPRHWLNNIQNYSANVQKKLWDLMGVTTLPEHGGRVILFHGEPGTGKTWALRSLMTEWREWARFEFIVDVERFFNDVSYAGQIVRARGTSRQRILVMEDADAYVARSTHRHAGMARLLNMADGILSENQKVAFLFTTNAPPDELDSALTRPGRCLAAIEFGPLSAEEANVHFAETTYRTSKPLTIAEVFMKRGVAPRISTASSPGLTGTYL